MVKYSQEPDNSTKSCKARGSDLRVHFKLTCHIELILSEKEEPVMKEPEAQITTSKSKKFGAVSS